MKKEEGSSNLFFVKLADLFPLIANPTYMPGVNE